MIIRGDHSIYYCVLFAENSGLSDLQSRCSICYSGVVTVHYNIIVLVIWPVLGLEQTSIIKRLSIIEECPLRGILLYTL